MPWPRPWVSTGPRKHRCDGMNGTANVISIKDLSIGFRSRAGHMLPVLRNVDLELSAGQSLGIVGESGSGKSTVALAAMGYLKRGLHLLSGAVTFNDMDMFSLDQNQLEEVRGGKIALIPQNSGQSLTPSLKVGTQLAEVLRLHTEIDESDRKDRVMQLLGQVRLPDPEAIYGRYPHELSGGQQQRVAIAMALAGDPVLLLLDEPTTGLDVTTQAHILELLRSIAAEQNTAMIYVSHDLGAIARVSNRVLVMYAGEVVLEGTTRQVLLTPGHPYARGLLASIPKLGDSTLPMALDGRPPPPGGAGKGCSFHDRCAIAEEDCKARRPELIARTGTGLSRCHYHDRIDQLPKSGKGSVPVKARPSEDVALDLDSLSISYHIPSLLDRLLKRDSDVVDTVEGIDIRVSRGETLGLVGESGSGKSTILKAIAGLLSPSDGRIAIKDTDKLPERVEDRTRDHLRDIQLIFQNPDESLNPRHTVEEILQQPLRLYFSLDRDEVKQRCSDILNRVRLGAHYLDRLPSQLSGGEKQRVAIARAFAANPRIVLCDEVTSALDVSVQAAVLDLLNELKMEQGTNYIFVSHDLAVVKALSDRVAVLYQGRLCEVGRSEHVYAPPNHPYTEVLLGAVLESDPDTEPRLLAEDTVELSPPARGCPFQRRCPRRVGDICDNELPPWQQGADGHFIRCHIPVEGLRSD